MSKSWITRHICRCDESPFGGAAGVIIPGAIIGSALMLFLFFPVIPALTVRKIPSNRIVALLPVKKNENFELSYIHSVNRGRVVDHFTVASDGTLLLDSSVFDSFGAGMSDGLDPGVTMSVVPDGIRISGLGRRLDTLFLAVGTVADHHLKTEKYEIILANRVDVGSRIKIGYENTSIYAQLEERIRYAGKQ